MTVMHGVDAPPPELLFKRKIRLGGALRELWRSRPLIRTLAERDLRVRYKQAVLGFVWAVISPFVLMVVFSLFFQRVATINTRGAPYPLFAYLGLIPWSFFSSSVTSGGMNILANVALMNKVYCPREVFPIAGVATTVVDTAMSVVVLAIMFVIYTFAPPLWALPWIPVLLAILVAFTVGVTLFVSAAVVYFRDLRQAIPLILQLGLFATPVAYGMDVIPARFRLVYVILNPIAEVIDGLRRVLLYHLGPDLHLLLAAGLSSMGFLVVGYVVFKRLETRFADVA